MKPDERVRVVGLVTQLADAMHAAGMEPSHELAVALIYLGSRIARECRSHPSDRVPAECKGT